MFEWLRDLCWERDTLERQIRESTDPYEEYEFRKQREILVAIIVSALAAAYVAGTA